jgi:biopolymer transport protein ExbB
MNVVYDTADYLRQGGWIMIPLVTVSVVMWTLIVDRLREFRALGRDDLDAHEVSVALAAADPDRLADRTGVRAVLVREFLRARSGRPRLDRDVGWQCVRRQRRELEKRLALIAVLAGIAPLLGLLGTVLGMVETFDVIAFFGTGNARALAGGISIALITTQTGLLVAIPGLLMSNRLGRMAQRLNTSLDEAAAVLLRHLKAEPSGPIEPSAGRLS